MLSKNWIDVIASRHIDAAFNGVSVDYIIGLHTKLISFPNYLRKNTVTFA